MKLVRHDQNDERTLGTLEIGDHVFRTIERPWRDNEKYVSCIPAGTYELDSHSGSKYPDTFVLLDVPDRTAILIHCGNRASHSQGCIIVGMTHGKWGEEDVVISSKAAMQHIRSLVSPGDTIEIINHWD